MTLESLIFRWSLLLLFLCAALIGRCTQDGALVPTGTVELRPMDQAAIEALRTDPAYDYDADLRRLPTPWERFKEWLRELLKEFFGSDIANFFARNVFFILVAVVLVFALYILSKGGLRRLFHGAPRSVGEVVSATEDIREMDLNTLIAEAERSTVPCSSLSPLITASGCSTIRP